MNKKTLAAYHEVGHAIVSYRLDLYGYDISIISENGTAGRFVCETLIDNANDCFREIVCLYAGYAAEKILDPDASPDGSWDDDDKAQQLLIHIDESEEDLRSQAAAIVSENWQAVEAIASKLIQYEVLVWEEWAIIIETIDAGREWEAEFLRTRGMIQALKNGSP